MATGSTRPKNTLGLTNFVAYEDSDWCCSVCKEKFRDVRKLPCGHFICGPLARFCIKRVLDYNQRKCPVERCGKLIGKNFDPDKAPRPQATEKQAARSSSPTPSIYSQNDGLYFSVMKRFKTFWSNSIEFGYHKRVYPFTDSQIHHDKVQLG